MPSTTNTVSAHNTVSAQPPLPEARRRSLTEIAPDTRTPVVQRIIGHARRDVARFGSAP